MNFTILLLYFSILIVAYILLWIIEENLIRNWDKKLIQHGIPIFKTDARELSNETITVDFWSLKGQFSSFKLGRFYEYLFGIAPSSIWRSYSMLIGIIHIDPEKKTIHVVGRIRWSSIVSLLFLYGFLLILLILKWNETPDTQSLDLTGIIIGFLSLSFFVAVIIIFHMEKYSEVLERFADKIEEKV